MLGSAVLDTAIGVVLIFAVTALLASGVTEFFSNFLQIRAKYLLGGLRSLLEDPATLTKVRAKGSALLKKTGTLATAARSPKGLAEEVLANPTVAGSVEKASSFLTWGKVRFPSYLSSTAFRTALLDTLLPDTVPEGQPTASLFAQLEAQVKTLEEPRARKALLAFLTEAQGDIKKVEASIEKWYDDQMSRASGWYKRYTQVVLAVVGLLAALVLNIDTLQVGHALWENEPLRTAVASAATNGTICQDAADAGAKTTCTTDQLESLKASGLPLGWTAGCAPLDGKWSDCFTWEPGTGATLGSVVLKILGWLLTALAVSFGAPFWFDALSKLGSLRSAGKKPSSDT